MVDVFPKPECPGKEYLGDGVYVDFDGYHIWLTTENGVMVVDKIALDPSVWHSLMAWRKRLVEFLHRSEVQAKTAAANVGMEQFLIDFVPSGRGKAQCDPDPHFPNGKEIKIPSQLNQAPHCKAALPYPAPECGCYLVTCKKCGFSLAVTAAGRPDDPTSIEMFCKTKTDELPLKS